MARCLEQQADVWEKRLDGYEYGAALKRVSAEAAPSLRRAQRLWVKYRESQAARCTQTTGEDQLGLLGAGVLEDLMDDHGSDSLTRVEAAAKRERCYANCR